MTKLPYFIENNLLWVKLTLQPLHLVTLEISNNDTYEPDPYKVFDYFFTKNDLIDWKQDKSGLHYKTFQFDSVFENDNSQWPENYIIDYQFNYNYSKPTTHLISLEHVNERRVYLDIYTDKRQVYVADNGDFLETLYLCPSQGRCQIQYYNPEIQECKIFDKYNILLYSYLCDQYYVKINNECIGYTIDLSVSPDVFDYMYIRKYFHHSLHNVTYKYINSNCLQINIKNTVNTPYDIQLPIMLPKYINSEVSVVQR